MAISVTDPLDPAIKKTRSILFEPFNATKWFALGFCAWLANLASAGGSHFSILNYTRGFGGIGTPGGNNPGTPNFGTPNTNPFNDVLNWILSNAVIVVGIAVALFILIVALGLLFSWLGSHGQFMFLDGIVKNTGAVKEPWHEFQREGNSLFKFKVIYGLISLFFFIVLAGGCFLLAWSDISSKTFGALSVTAFIVFAVPSFLFLLVALFIGFLLNNFIVPTMYKRRINVLDAFHIVRNTFMPHKATLGLYFLFQIVLGIGIGIAAMMATFCLCCIPAIPFIGTVILLPIFVFLKTYTLYFLEQFGPEWQFFSSPTEVAPHIADGGLSQDTLV
jgi:hypothetical protein